MIAWHNIVCAGEAVRSIDSALHFRAFEVVSHKRRYIKCPHLYDNDTFIL